MLARYFFKIITEKTLAVLLGKKAGSDERICRVFNLLDWTKKLFNNLSVTVRITN